MNRDNRGRPTVDQRRETIVHGPLSAVFFEGRTASGSQLTDLKCY